MGADCSCLGSGKERVAIVLKYPSISFEVQEEKPKVDKSANRLDEINQIWVGTEKVSYLSYFGG